MRYRIRCLRHWMPPAVGLNVLIGSRRFAEGWDNLRASSLTLLRLGQGEGSLIIQMFGRGGAFRWCGWQWQAP